MICKKFHNAKELKCLTLLHTNSGRYVTTRGEQCACTNIEPIKRGWYATWMLKLDPKSIFWSLAVHRYPKQPPRVIIFAAMGPGMKLVIAKNFLAKKNENLKFFCKTYVIYIKRKLRTCRIQIQEERVWFILKELEKNEKINFFDRSDKIIFFFLKKRFFNINHTFSSWIWILHVLSFFLMYIT